MIRLAPLLFLMFCAAATAAADTPSRIIIVKNYPQSEWHVKAGETLSEIVEHLEPDDFAQQQRLAHYLQQQNPQAFLEDNPDKLLAGTRLRLPHAATQKPRSTGIIVHR